MWETTKCREDAIRREAATGCKERKWAAMVHLMALSPVIGRPIYSAFPNDNSKTRPLFHGEISPRETPIQTDGPFILWSRDGSRNTRPEGWYRPNHFVPLVERLAISSPEKCPVTSPIKKPVKDGTKTKA